MSTLIMICNGNITLVLVVFVRLELILIGLFCVLTIILDSKSLALPYLNIQTIIKQTHAMTVIPGVKIQMMDLSMMQSSPKIPHKSVQCGLFEK